MKLLGQMKCFSVPGLLHSVRLGGGGGGGEGISGHEREVSSKSRRRSGVGGVEGKMMMIAVIITLGEIMQ